MNGITIEEWEVILAVVIGFGIPILIQVGKLGSIEGAINGLKGTLDSLILSIQVISAKRDTSIVLEQQVKEIKKLLNHSISKKNPLSEEEIAKFRSYYERIGKRIPLKYEEYKDFEELSKRIRKELPRKKKTEFDLHLASLKGFVAGAALVELTERCVIAGIESAMKTTKEYGEER